MRNGWLLCVVPVVILTGCASSQKIGNLEARLNSVEQKLNLVEQRQASFEVSVSEKEAPLPANFPESKPLIAPASMSKKDIQTALKSAGYYSGAIDGKFGRKTRKAIREFQRANGLTVDGIAGIKTKELLAEYLR